MLAEAGPKEFLGLICDAAIVLTDSFHCTAFSALHKKEFFSFRRYQDEGTVSTNGRLYSLLSSLNLSERMLSANEPVEDCLKIPIDYPSVSQRIEQMREFSIRLFKKSIY